MTKFSERVGAVPPRQIQRGVMDDALRVGIWNWMLWSLEKDVSSQSSWTDKYWYGRAKAGLWDEILHKPADEIDRYSSSETFKVQFFTFQWYQVYEAVEWMLPRINSVRGVHDQRGDLDVRLNSILEREMSAYRFVKGHIVEVASAVELAEIQQAATPKPVLKASLRTFKAR
jgi:AbiJ-like protein